MTFRTHRVLTPQEYEVNNRIQRIQDTEFDTEKPLSESQLSPLPPELILGQQNDCHLYENDYWQLFFQRYIINGDGNCFFSAVNVCMTAFF